MEGQDMAPGVTNIISELAPDAKILPIRIAFGYGGNSTQQLKRALQYILNKKEEGINITKVNMSYELGSANVEELKPLLIKVTDSGINFIKSADNNSQELPSDIK
jgi:hypothetical protein